MASCGGTYLVSVSVTRPSSSLNPPPLPICMHLKIRKGGNSGRSHVVPPIPEHGVTTILSRHQMDEREGLKKEAVGNLSSSRMKTEHAVGWCELHEDPGDWNSLLSSAPAKG